ncbi:MAG: hypothetical protein ACFE96_03945 [Candidatus Hermodarchaeota archaeon]
MEKIIYPPEKIYSPSKWIRPNYDHIILWMLSNNEMCKWADFRRKPLEIPPGTLSRHLEPLKRKGFVEKVSRGHYCITPEGEKEFRILSSTKRKEHKLNYPPDVILKSGRNYSHWILWMVYNNNYCKRSEFLDSPLSINQSSLSKNLSLLIEKGHIVKEEGKYIITHVGKVAYSMMLKEYDLDRQTILEEEGKRIVEITKKTVEFFDTFKIKDKDIQFRFLSYILILDYEKVKPILKDEEIFRKILLFLSLNHPDQYPNFISSEEFSNLYEIKKTTIDYYVSEISEGKIYRYRFFILTQSTGEQYYFQSDGKIERILRVMTENDMAKAFYLNRLFSDSKSSLPTTEVERIINDIVDKSCEFLFNKDLKPSLKAFLPEYIQYLAYKVETKRKLKEHNDKLEGIIWQNISEIIQLGVIEDLEDNFKENIKEINKKIKLQPDDLNLHYQKVRILIYFNQYREALKQLDELLGLFPGSEKDFKLLKATVLRRMQKIEAGLDIINELIHIFPNDKDLICYKAYWLQYLDNKEEAIELIQNLTETDPENGIYQDTYGEILMYFEDYDEAVNKFIKAMVLGSDDWYIYQTYIKLGICYNALDKRDLALKNLEEGKELIEKSTSDFETKQRWLTIANLFLAEVEQG